MNSFPLLLSTAPQAINLGEHDTQTWILWMDSLMLINEWHKAHEIARRAMQFHLRNPSVIYRLAGCKLRIGKKSEALFLFDQIKNKIKIPINISHLFPELIKI